MKKKPIRRLWKSELPEYPKYETEYVPAYPWNNETKEDIPRYYKDADGYWYAYDANDSGIALLSCTGDLMCEPRQHKAHRYGDSYFFHPMFQFVRGVFKASDLVIGNLETTLSEYTPYAGEYHRILDSRGEKQFHCNAPECYLESLRYAGFDVLVNANNHDLDSGVVGLVETLEKVDKHRFLRTGTFLPEEQERVLLVNVNGIKLALMSYATYMNKQDINLTEEGLEQLLNRFSPERVERDVAWAREHGAEYVIAYIHSGSAYKHDINDKQREITQAMADAGVDYIIGSHSHCLQYHGTITASDGRSVPVVYGMGNFVTNEVREICKHTGILQLLLKKEEDRIHVSSYFVPCYVFDEFGTGRFAAVPTNPQLNGGFYSEKLQEAERYIENVVSSYTPLLPVQKLMLSEVCRLAEMDLPADLQEMAVARCCLDLKEVAEHSLFFALNEDEEELRKAYKAGAVAIVATKPVEDIPTLVVKSVEDVYCKVCRKVKGCYDVKTIVVTGHSNKTRTKEMVQQVLRDRAPVLVSGADPNADTAAWQRLHPQHQYYVQEISDDHPARARLLLKALQPDVCILTDYSKQTKEIFKNVASNGLVIINGDDFVLETTATYAAADENGRVRRTAFRVKNLKTTDSNLTFEVAYEGHGQQLGGKLPFDEVAYAMSAAYALGIEEGISAEQITRALSRYHGKGYEQNILTVDGTMKLILNCTCKTSNSAVSALRAFKEQNITADGKRIAVLGDLDFATDMTEDMYTSVLEAAFEYASDILCLMGKNMEQASSIVHKKGFPFQKLLLLPSAHALEAYLLENLEPEDALLFCGGRGMQFSMMIRKLFGFTDGQIFGVW